MINGKKLKALRISKGFNQTQLADRVGISGSHYSHLESGERGASYATMEAIAQALGVPVTEIMQDGELVSGAREIVIEITDANNRKGRVTLPQNADSLKLVGEYLAGRSGVLDENLQEVILKWEELTNSQRERIQTILREK